VVQLPLRHLIEKIGLIFVFVGGPQQIIPAALVRYIAVMPRRNTVRPQPARELHERAEFHLSVAQHVGIGSSALAVLVEKKAENSLHVFRGKVHGIIRYVYMIA